MIADQIKVLNDAYAGAAPGRHQHPIPACPREHRPHHERDLVHGLLRASESAMKTAQVLN